MGQKSLRMGYKLPQTGLFGERQRMGDNRQMPTVSRRFDLYGFLLLLLLAVGCRETTEPDQTPSLTITSTETATRGHSATAISQITMPASLVPTQTNPLPTASATAAPTGTAGPTNTPTATLPPTRTPTPWPTPQVIRDRSVTLPPGFSFIEYAEIFRPTAFAFDELGRLFVASFDGTIHVLLDNDGDGRSDLDALYFSGLATPLGLAFRPGTNDLYVSLQGGIFILRDTDGDNAVDSVRSLVENLPYGRHQNNNLVFGPDGYIYVGVGSTCDACEEEDGRSATILRIDPDTGAGFAYATGLRNPFGLAFDPVSNALFATDNGRDDLGPEAPKEEFNHIVANQDYGFPYCWDEMNAGDCENSKTAIGFFEAHSSANTIVFYAEESFPPSFRGDAYVTIFGSWLVQGLRTGIARVSLEPAGDTFTTEIEWFASWEGGMPLGMIVGPDGAIYVGDYINDRVYRISYGIP